MNSVNTNVGAMIALQSLNSTNNELSTTQSRINTGRKVNTAKDNGAIWAIAQNQRAESQSLNSVMGSLQRGQSSVDVALSAGQRISDVLVEMKEKAAQASDVTLDTASKTALSEEYESLRNSIDTIATNAVFDGVNLIDDGTDSIAALASADATSTITVAHQDLSLSGSAISGTAADLTGTVDDSTIAAIDEAIEAVSAGLSKLGTGGKAIDNHLNFVMKLQDTLDAGIGNLVDADLAKESAKLQALQTKQQLGVQALSIANQSSGTLLSLFR